MSKPLSPSEILESFPEIKKAGWSASDLGICLRMNLLRGSRNSAKKVSLIDPDSLKTLVDLHDTNVSSYIISKSKRK